MFPHLQAGFKASSARCGIQISPNSDIQTPPNPAFTRRFLFPTEGGLLAASAWERSERRRAELLHGQGHRHGSAGHFVVVVYVYVYFYVVVVVVVAFWWW